MSEVNVVGREGRKNECRCFQLDRIVLPLRIVEITCMTPIVVVMGFEEAAVDEID